MSVASSSSVSKTPIIGNHSNHLKLGLVGTTNVGKSSFFNACLQDALKFAEVDVCLFGTVDPHMGHFIPVDEKIDYIESIITPKRTIRTRCTVIDTAGLVPGSFLQGEGLGAMTLNSIRDADVLLHIIREFENENVSHYEGSIDPLRDIDTINQELLFYDLDLIETAITSAENIRQRGIGGVYIQYQWEVLIKAWEVIAGQSRPLRAKVFKKTTVFKKMKLPLRCEGTALRYGTWDYNERLLLSEMKLLTTKRMLYLINMSMRDYLRNGKKETFQSICTAIDHLGGDSIADVLRISTIFEMYLYQIKHIEKRWEEYLQANPHHQSVIPKIIDEILRGLGLIRFYIINDNEIKCFLLRNGKTIVEASLLIDVFIGRNFIRGDVIAFEEYQKFHGDRIKIIIEGKLRQETKRYLVNDGDIIEFHYHKK